MIKIEAKFKPKQYVKIRPLDNLKGRIIGIYFDGADVTYKVEYYADSVQNQIFLFEDEISIY
jgi:hypothetical protein